MRCLMSLVALMLLCSPVLGAEAEVDVGAESKMLFVKFVLDLVWKIAIPVAFAWLAKKGYDGKMVKGARYAVEMGVTNAYENYVRGLKQDTETHPNGKLKADERKSAKQWAMNKAIDFATGGSKKLLLKWGAEGVGNLIEKIISRRKKRR